MTVKTTTTTTAAAKTTKPAAPAKRKVNAKRGTTAKRNAKRQTGLGAVANKVAAENVAKKEAKAAEAKQMAEEGKVTAYALQEVPKNGMRLFTYTIAVLTTLGGFTPHRKAMKKEDVKAFYKTNSVVRNHTGNGNFEETADGKLRLSATGYAYFHGRITGSNVAQKVHQPEVKALAEAMKIGKLEKSTEHYGTNTAFKEIHISG